MTTPPDDTSKGPQIESVALAIGLTVLGLWMILAPGAVEGAQTGGRHSGIKMILSVIWGTNGGIALLVLGLASLAWMYRPGRTPRAS